MHALFANLTKDDFGYRAKTNEEARLYALAAMVWEEVHETIPRSESRIAVLLEEMKDIVARKAARQPRKGN